MLAGQLAVDPHLREPVHAHESHCDPSSPRLGGNHKILFEPGWTDVSPQVFKNDLPGTRYHDLPVPHLSRSIPALCLTDVLRICLEMPFTPETSNNPPFQDGGP